MSCFSLHKMSINIQSYCFWLSGSKFSLIPLKYCFKSNGIFQVEQIVIRPIVRFSWWLLIMFSYIITLYDLYHTLTYFETKNLIRIMYHIFLLLTKTATIVDTAVFQNKSLEICNLLNILSGKWVANINSTVRKNRSSSFVVFTTTGTLSTFMFYIFITPAIAIVKPCLHDSVLVWMPFVECNSLTFRIVAYLFQFFSMLPTSALGATAFCTVLMTLGDLSTQIKNLW